MAPADWPLLAWVAASAFLLWKWWRAPDPPPSAAQLESELDEFTWVTPAAAPAPLQALWEAYRLGTLRADALAAYAVSNPTPPDLPYWQNTLVCLDVATGRYREALEWRARLREPPTGDSDKLLRVNEAEALALPR